MVIQGGDGAVGSRRAEVRGLIANARQRAGVTITPKTGGFTIAGPAQGFGEIKLVAMRSSVAVQIGRGENSNRTIRYSNVFLGEGSLGTWRGGTQEVAIPRALLGVAAADRYAVIIQKAGHGPILAGHYL
jgi:hypothetical protein